jgi:hypothetical protein
MVEGLSRYRPSPVFNNVNIIKEYLKWRGMQVKPTMKPLV